MERKTIRRGKRGESLIETMFALLVGSVSIMLLATMIAASAKLIRLSEENTDKYAIHLNRMNNPDGGETDEEETDGKGTAEFRFRYDSNGDGEINDADPAPNPDTADVKIKSFRDGKRAPVISYEKAREDTEGE